MAAGERSTLRANNTTIYYERYGPLHGEKRLLLLSPSNTPLKDLIPHVIGPGSACKLDSQFSCLVFDHRGIGQSGKHTSAWPQPTIEVYVDDVLALLQHVGWTSANIVAFSFGGAVAQALLLRRPATFHAQRVLLVCPASDVSGPDACSYPLTRLLGYSPEERARELLFLADVRRDDDWLESDLGQAAMYFVMQQEKTLEQVPEAAAGRRYQYLAREAQIGTIAQLRAAHAAAASSAEANGGEANGGETTSSPPPAAATTTPLCEALCVAAAVYDNVTPPSGIRLIHGAMPGSTLVWFEAGHWPNVAREQNALFGKAVRSFLAGEAIGAEVLAASSDAEALISTRPGRYCGGWDVEDCTIL